MELGPLVDVEDLRPPLAQGLLQGFHAEGSVEGVGDPPSQHVTAEPVHDRHQVDEAAGQGQIGDVAATHLARPVHGQPSRQIRYTRCSGSGVVRCRRGEDGLQAHGLHQAMHALGIDRVAVASQGRADPSHAVDRVLGVDPVDGVHQLEGERIRDHRAVVETRAGQPEQLALTVDAQLGMRRVDLAGVDGEFAGQLVHRLALAQGLQSHLGLELSRVRLAFPRHPSPSGQWAAGRNVSLSHLSSLRGTITLTTCPQIFKRVLFLPVAGVDLVHGRPGI